MGDRLGRGNESGFSGIILPQRITKKTSPITEIRAEITTMKLCAIFGMAAMMIGGSAMAQTPAGDAAAGAKLNSMCVGCHGIEGYKTQFKKVFGTDVTSDGMAKAIAAYERTVISGNAPFDKFKAGDTKALSESAQRGMKLFFGKAHCSACHAGPNFSDNSFHNVGVGMDKKDFDKGRADISKLSGDTGAFKTPTLREIAKSGPYFHDGSAKTLEEVVEHYAKGGIPNKWLDEEIFNIKIAPTEKADLVKFMTEGLSSPDYPDHKAPELPK